MANSFETNDVNEESLLEEMSTVAEEAKHVVTVDARDTPPTTTVVLKSKSPLVRKLTVDRLPSIEHYRLGLSLRSTRPSLAQLHEETSDTEETALTATNSVSNIEAVSGMPSASLEFTEPHLTTFEEPEVSGGAPKFGWIQGVLIRCILNILGVMLYLRISWVTGQAGIALGSMVVLLSVTVTTLTAISMCAISTNGEIRGGGAYFMISRSLGPEFGGSIGLIFALANAVGAAMHIVGFSETVRDLMKEHDATIVDGGLDDIRIIGIATAIFLIAICFIGTGFESKMQLVLLVVLAVSLFNYVIGTFFPLTTIQELRGVTGFSAATFAANFLPEWRSETFISVFAVFFPSATGIMAGANISGDLKDPQTAIPKGTLLSVLITTVIYLAVVWFTGSTCVRDASGTVEDSMAAINVTELDRVYVPHCARNGTCPYGLMNYFQVMELESAYGPLVTAGIFAATLSSALASLVSAPKVFEAVCKDRLYPYIHWFAEGYGQNKEPRRAYVLAFVIAALMILIGDLNAMAPIISNFFLAAYALVNFATFHASFAESPGFRPSFKYYNMWASLLGAALCVSVMFVISWWTAMLTFIFVTSLYIYVLKRKPDVNWGSSTQAHTYKIALRAILKGVNTEEHVKNYRPQILALTGNPVARPSLVDFVANITKGNSWMACGHVILHQPNGKSLRKLQAFTRQIELWLQARKVKAFYRPVLSPSIRTGVQHLLQLAGMGKLRPNIILIGFKHNWQTSRLQEIQEYFDVLHDAFDTNLSVAIFRMPKGLDCSELMKEHAVGETELLDLFESYFGSAVANPSGHETDETAEVAQSFSSEFSGHNSMETLDVDDGDRVNERAPLELLSPLAAFGRHISHSPMEMFNIFMNRIKEASVDQATLLASMNQFQSRIKKGTIDVWWLYDDGGLTLLIPHLLSAAKSYLEGATLRVFTIASNAGQHLKEEQEKIAALLSKFRINFLDVYIIADIDKEPNRSSILEFEYLIESFRAVGAETKACGLITEAELAVFQDKSHRILRTRELLLQHSKNASLVVVTLPVPRKGGCSASLYMAWLELLTKGMPPILLLRGNQQSVLTFYS